MIPVKETKPGQFERITGNPTLKSLDGTRKAPLRTILHKSWSAADRAAFGVYVVEPAAVPEGKRTVGAPRYERQGAAVVEVRDLEDVPKPVEREFTAEEKVDGMLSTFGLTFDEFVSVLGKRSIDNATRD